MGEPVPFGVEELARPPPLTSQGTGDLQDPARGNPLNVAAQVSTGDAQHVVRRAGQGGEQVAVLAFHPLGAQGQFVAGRGPFVIGEQGVVARRRREQPFGQPEHDDQVEVEADPHARSDPTRTPSPMRPTRPRSDSSSSSRVRVNTARSTDSSTASREARRSRARSTRSAAFCSTTGQAVRRRSPPNSDAGDDGPRRPARSRAAAGRPRSARSSIKPRHELPQRPRLVGLVAQALGPPGGRVWVAFGQRRLRHHARRQRWPTG